VSYLIENTRESVIEHYLADDYAVYYDNVGGEQLEAAITCLKDWGRIGKSLEPCLCELICFDR
jgi:NADPH-dependent curcumin reductase CurA